MKTHSERLILKQSGERRRCKRDAGNVLRFICDHEFSMRCPPAGLLVSLTCMQRFSSEKLAWSGACCEIRGVCQGLGGTGEGLFQRGVKSRRGKADTAFFFYCRYDDDEFKSFIFMAICV